MGRSLNRCCHGNVTMCCLCCCAICCYVADNNVGHRSLCRVQILTKIWIFSINFNDYSPTRISRQSVQLEQHWHMRTLQDYANTPTNCSTSYAPQCRHYRLLLNTQCTHTLPTLNHLCCFGCLFWMTTNIQWRLQCPPPVVCMVLKATSPLVLLILKKKKLYCKENTYSTFKDKLQNCSLNQSE
jgi:hypothetical protein